MEEEADAANLLKPEELERPEDARWPEWSDHIQAAWSELRDDRHYGDMGGMGRIYFAAIDAYAARFDISEFADFLTFVRAIDDEYMRHTIEQQKAEAAKTKT